MKAIPTIYKGIEYRSRLEARWAVFFERIGLDAQYEPFEIENNGLTYTPDFLAMNGFNGKNPIIEIKPREISQQYLDYLLKIRDPKKSVFLVFVGNPLVGNIEIDDDLNIVGVVRDCIWQPDGYYIHTVNSNGILNNVAAKGFWLNTCSVCGQMNINHRKVDYMPTCINCNGRIDIRKYKEENANEYRFDLKLQQWI